MQALVNAMPLRTWPLVIVTALVASACVTVLPRAQTTAAPPTPSLAADLQTPAPASSTPSPDTTSTPPVAPSPGRTPKPGRTSKPRPSATAPPTELPTANPPLADTPECRDDAYVLTGNHWSTPLEWYFDEGSTPPGYDPAEVLAVIQTGFANVTEARNDCGLPDEVNAQATYMGTTDQSSCTNESDGENVVGFDSLHGDLLALTCPWSYSDGEFAEVDIVLDNSTDWALSKDCSFQYYLEAVVTHEVGHAFGLDHVGQREHSALTMSPRGGMCDASDETLGLGDVLGLEQLYGTP
jgi:Matrixin